MRLLILGASGGCGRWLTRLAHERSHDVAALVRPQSDMHAPAGVTIHTGDVTDAAVLDRVLPGNDAVFCALGLRRSGRFPWAPLRSPPDLMQRVAKLLTEAMQRHSVSRLIAISGAGVGDSIDSCSWLARCVIRSGNIAVACRDLEAMEAVLAASNLDWMVVRPVTLISGPPKRAARPVDCYRLSSVIRRSEVATYMLDAIEQSPPFKERIIMLGR